MPLNATNAPAEFQQQFESLLETFNAQIATAVATWNEAASYAYAARQITKQAPDLPFIGPIADQMLAALPNPQTFVLPVAPVDTAAGLAAFQSLDVAS